MNIETAEITLKQVFKKDRFNQHQKEIIEAVLNQNDVLAILPTGGGKSLCYQLPGLIQDGICVVISPLVALINDQIRELKKYDISSSGIFGSMSQSKIDIALDNCIYGNTKFLFLPPERLNSFLVKERLKKMKVSLIAIDEAHCISTWGHDFRPSYLNISSIKEIFPNTPTIALTATATQKVRKDIVDNLILNKPKVFVGGFERSNIYIDCKKSEDKARDLIELVGKNAGSGIIYVGKRKHTTTIQNILEKNGVPAFSYHAGYTHKEKAKNYKEWLKSDNAWMVATSAFGMGINKSDVRTVVHFYIPDAIEDYYQQIGRAGRDGKPSIAILLFNENDFAEKSVQLKDSFPEREQIKKVYNSLFNYLQLAVGSGENEGFPIDLKDLCTKFDLNYRTTYHSLKLLEKLGLILFSEDVKSQSKLKVVGSKLQLNHLASNPSVMADVLQTILRSYSGLFNDYQPISESDIAKKTGKSRDEIINMIQIMEQRELVEYQFMSFLPKVIFLQNRIDASGLKIPKSILEDRREIKSNQLSNFFDFIKNELQCKQQLILHYFGQNSGECGNCCVCKSDDLPEIIKDIKNCLNTPKTLAKLTEELSYERVHIAESLKVLMEKGLVNFDGIESFSLVE